jgi:oligopeptide/dipeptide ABC transporter ATP-binding protein
VTSSAPPLVEIEDLKVAYAGDRTLLRRAHPVPVLEHFTLTVQRGETLGIVGESGCGKTTLLRTLLGLIRPVDGRALLDGQSMLEADGRRRRELGRYVSMVFQNPASSLDPRMTLRETITEPLRIHTTMTRAERHTRAAALAHDVGLTPDLLGAYPSRISGGQAQRVSIARALALEPLLVLLDEPTSALDVSVQAQVLNLLVTLQEQRDLTYVFVSHDLEVVRHVADRIAVMYLGQIVELADASELFARPLHPYTQALMSAVPSDEAAKRDRIVLTGTVPGYRSAPRGCRFHTRCPFVMDVCRDVVPDSVPSASQGWVRCHLYQQAAAASAADPRSEEADEKTA